MVFRYKTLATFVFIVFALFAAFGASLKAQWRTVTPRDAVTVFADGKTVNSGLTLTTGVLVSVKVSGTFSLFKNQTGGIDGAYTYQVPNWNIFTPLENPPVYQTVKFDWGLYFDPNGKGFVPFTSKPYQTNHIYTAYVTSEAHQFSFRIQAPPSYFPGTGFLKIDLARWTAGIAIQKPSLDFGNVPVGKPKSLLDSIASYGIDPLSIDSVKIIGTLPNGNSDFQQTSQRGNNFTLASETTNTFTITVTPSIQGEIHGELHIYCHNADNSGRETVIPLRAFGTEASGVVGPDSLKFGLVRIGTSKILSVLVTNVGNADLLVTNATFNPNDNIFVRTGSLPRVSPFSVLPVKIQFQPQARQHYHSTATVTADAKTYNIDLQGDGAAPVPVLSPKILNFGPIYNGDTKTLGVTLKNTGNWTCTVIKAEIVSPFAAAFSFTPKDTAFYVEPDSSRNFNISLAPQTRQEGWPIFGWFVLTYDDNSKDTVEITATEIQPKYILKNHLYDFGKVKIDPSPGWAGVKRVVDTIFAPNSKVTMQPLELQQPSNFFSLDGQPHQTFDVQKSESVEISATFKPLIQGPWRTYLYTYDGLRKDSVELRGIGAIAKAIFNPDPISFGTVKTGVHDTVKTKLTDSGDYPLKIVWYEITGQNAGDFHVVFPPTPLPGYVITEGSSVQIAVEFSTNAKTGEVHRATLCVHYDDSTSDCVPLEGIEEAQYLQFKQTSVNFGKVRVGKSLTKGAAFVNNSNKSLKVDTVMTTPIPGPFSIAMNLPSVIAGGTDSALVQFAPTIKGILKGHLVGTGGDFKTDSIELTGTGAAPVPIFDKDTIDFGIVKMNSSQPRSLTLSNQGDWTLQVNDIKIINDKFNEFTYIKVKSAVASIEDTVAENRTSDYVITFTPNHTLVYHEAKMIFTYDDGTTSTVLLKGYDESPFLVLDLDTLNLGKVRIGTTGNGKIDLVSTAPGSLTADNLHLNGPAEFTASPLGKITVPARVLQAITVNFTPQVIGTLEAKLITDTCAESSQDTTIIVATGAMPVATFASDTLDFGQLFVGKSASRTFELSNTGNWDLKTISATFGGAHPADFTAPTMPQAITVLEQTKGIYQINFLATTPYQAAARYAEIEFTLDDGSKFKLFLKAQDIAPIPVDLKFDNSNMRLSDKVYPFLRLQTPIPDTLNVTHLHGIVTWDPNVLSPPISVEESEMLQKDGWTLTPIGSNPPGTYEYDLQTSSGRLSTPGPLLRFEFKAALSAQVGNQTTLVHTLVELPGRTEFTLSQRQGIIVIDSSCGSTHLLQDGQAQKNFIEMNSPNPFGTGTATDVTNIGFAIATDGTPVTLRILDVTGREVLRPLNAEVFNQGYYRMKISSYDLPNSGTYLYEFRAAGDSPTVRKMIVRK